MSVHGRLGTPGSVGRQILRFSGSQQVALQRDERK